MDDLLVDVLDDRGRITINRPDRRNAFTEAVLQSLAGAVREFNADPSIKVVVLSGAGPDFCSGRDLDDLPAYGPSAVPDKRGQLTNSLADLEMPVVAKLRGAVVGGGMGLALMCDVVLADETTFFVDGHLRAGMTPGSAVWWLPRLVGYQAAMSIMLTGRKVSAQEALQRGFVTTIVPPHELDAAVDQTCAQICRADRDVLIRTKRAVRHALESDFAHSTEQVGYLRSLPRSTQ
jgi:enoyl-CoA hydratase/carnithine racemase